MSKIVIATHNAGKRLEIAALLEPLGISVIGAGELDLPEPEETGATFIENARIKAQSASELTGLAALSDDSGLVVPGLDGQPGIYSARWAGPNRDFNLAMTKVNDGLTERNADRAAYMVCVLCLSLPGGRGSKALHYHDFEGRIDGTLVWPPRGSKGFGYDPIFKPEGYSLTFGEMDPDEKEKISHRGRAFEQLLAAKVLSNRRGAG